MGARSLFSLFSSKESVLLLFFLEEKNGQLAREAQALRRTDAGTSCVVVGRNTTAGMPPSSALSLPVSAAPARLRFPCKPTTQKKINCGTVILCRSRRFCRRATQNGRFVCEPSVFFVSSKTCGKASFLRKTSSPALSFVSFLQEKKSFPFQKKRNRTPSVTRQRNPG